MKEIQEASRSAPVVTETEVLEAADADWAHIAKMEFWTPTADKGTLDPFWVEKFPDPDSRPARHTHVGHGDSARASFIAYIED